MKPQTALLTGLILLLTTALVDAAPPWNRGYMGHAPNFDSQQFQHHGTSSLWVQRYSYPDGYRVRITVRGLSPESIGIFMQDGALQVENSTSSMEQHHNGRGARGGFQSWSSMSQRIPLPQDADFQRMTRENGKGTVILTIPRRQYRRW